ncbi:hypothetical protein [Sinorhizobium meliloti]|uniref:hypothetical protein n=1 Tax=Rhizobium meliloti TaxID=382 RepID=UPI00041E7995|nr:hypothetical protein [Sinorhizobium meliloti]
MDVDLYEGRIALLSRHGPPLRGYVTTDLDQGAYTLTVDRPRKVWLIHEVVKPGLRFTIDLDGPDPFELDYEQPIVLTAHEGMPSAANADSMLEIIANLNELSEVAIWNYLTNLSDIMLYDTLDQLWTGETYGQAIIMKLLSSFESAVRALDDVHGLARVLRAIESFSAKPAQLYVDAFDSYLVDPDSREPDPEREKQNLSTWQLRLIYSKMVPVRSLVLYTDDILDTSGADPDPPVYGPANLLYPKWLTKATTPRLAEAKRVTLERLAYENIIAIIEQSVDAFEKIQMAWTIYGLAQPLAGGLLKLKSRPDKWAGSVGAARDPNAPWRWKGIQPAKGGPGRWVRDSEGGANMSHGSAWYQLRRRERRPDGATDAVACSSRISSTAC